MLAVSQHILQRQNMARADTNLAEHNRNGGVLLLSPGFPEPQIEDQKQRKVVHMIPKKHGREKHKHIHHEIQTIQLSFRPLLLCDAADGKGSASSQMVSPSGPFHFPFMTTDDASAAVPFNARSKATLYTHETDPSKEDTQKRWLTFFSPSLEP